MHKCWNQPPDLSRESVNAHPRLHSLQCARATIGMVGTYPHNEIRLRNYLALELRLVVETRHHGVLPFPNAILWNPTLLLLRTATHRSEDHALRLALSTFRRPSKHAQCLCVL